MISTKTPMRYAPFNRTIFDLRLPFSPFVQSRAGLSTLAGSNLGFVIAVKFKHLANISCMSRQPKRQQLSRPIKAQRYPILEAALPKRYGADLFSYMVSDATKQKSRKSGEPSVENARSVRTEQVSIISSFKSIFTHVTHRRPLKMARRTRTRSHTKSQLERSDLRGYVLLSCRRIGAY